MASFNRVILMGNLTRDPQVRYTPGGTAVAELGLAVNRTWFDKQTNTRKEDVTFVDVTLWGRTAEIAGEYLGKGRQVLIEGRLQTDSWDDKETGQKRSKLKVVCENMTMVGGRTEGGAPGGGGGGGQRAASRPTGGGAPVEMAQPEPDYGGGGGSDYGSGNDGGGSPPDDEVPF
ncbi:MAG: single-stranded DNA-binding protein [Planctomycetaceae bacterium]|nr:single-stranded DNA-binding protein [Planctomycetaceae bacterium]